MNNPQKLANQNFLQILGIGGIWLLISFGVTGRYLLEIFQLVYRICQSSWNTFSQHIAINYHLIVPTIIIIILGRGIYLFAARLWKTYWFTRTLLLKKSEIPSRVSTLAKKVKINPQTIICIQTNTVQAFSLGIWSPKIWLSTELITLLDDDELMAVLCHEMHHCQKFDPVRLLVSRLISDIFFFIPRINSLADHHHLAQEMAADAAAVAHLGDNLPLASALHKLLTYPHNAFPTSKIAISQLNITERRILALVSPDMNMGWQSTLVNWGGTLLLMTVLFGLLFLTDPLVQQTITPCTA